MPGGTMKTQNEQWGQSNYEVSKFYIFLKPMLLQGTFIFSVYTKVQVRTVLRIRLLKTKTAKSAHNH